MAAGFGCLLSLLQYMVRNCDSYPNKSCAAHWDLQGHCEHLWRLSDVLRDRRVVHIYVFNNILDRLLTILPPLARRHSYRASLRCRLHLSITVDWIVHGRLRADDAEPVSHILASTTCTSVLHWYRLWVSIHTGSGHSLYVLQHKACACTWPCSFRKQYG